MPSIPQPHPSTRQPLPPRPDPEAQLLEAVRSRDQQLIRHLVPWWVHRRGLEALHRVLERTLSPSDAAETLAWIQAQIGAPLQPPSGASPLSASALEPARAPLNPEAEWLAQASSNRAVLPASPAEPGPCPEQQFDQAVAAVDAAIAQLMAEFPAETLAGLPPRQALAVLDGLEGSPALAGLALVEPPAELLRDPDFQPQLASPPCPDRAAASEPAMATAFTPLVAATPSAAGADGNGFGSEPMGGAVAFNGPLSFTIPQTEPTPLGLSGTAPAVEDTAEDGGLMLEQTAAESFRSLGGSLIAPLRGRLGVRRLARRLIDRAREVGLVGSEGGLVRAAGEPPAQTNAALPCPAASELELLPAACLDGFELQDADMPGGLQAAAAACRPSTNAAYSDGGQGTGFDGTGRHQAAADDAAVDGTAFEAWTPTIPAQGLGERLRERMRQPADLSPDPHGDSVPAPRPAALADLGAWLPSAELPRAS